MIERPPSANSPHVISQVVVPYNYPEFTTRRVFVSEWIDGEKLSQSKADDVQDLVNVGVTACETMHLIRERERER